MYFRALTGRLDMAGKRFPKKQSLLPIQNTFGGHQMKAKLPMMSLVCELEGYPLVHKRNLDI